MVLSHNFFFYGMPQTGEAISTAMIVSEIILVAIAGMITLKKCN